MDPEHYNAFVQIEQRVVDLADAVSTGQRHTRNNVATVIRNQQVILDAIQALGRRLEQLEKRLH